MEWLIPALFCLQAILWRAVLALPYRTRQVDAETLARLRELAQRTRPSAAGASIGLSWEARRRRLLVLAINLEQWN